MKCYKLTDEDNQTRHQTQWGPEVSYTAKGEGEKLCSDGWIHFYRHPLIAVLMNPIHANFSSPRLWEAESSGAELHEPLKSGCKTLTTIKRIPMPRISLTQRIAFGILCAKKICRNRKWNQWANKWLSGEDRTKDAAYVAYHTATYAADNASAAHAAYAAHTTRDAAAKAAASAVAVVVYDSDNKIDFIKLVEKAMTYK